MMYRGIITITGCIYLLSICAISRAEEKSDTSTVKGWKLLVGTNLTLTLNSYNNTWIGGDAGSFAWAWQFNGSAEKQLKPWLNNANKLKLAFGQTKIQNTETDQWSAPAKSTDQIDMEALFNFTLKTWIDPFLAIRAISQFLDASVPEKEYYFNPWEITESAGGLRDLIKKDLLSWNVRLGAASRQIVNRMTPDTITVDGGIDLNSELKAANRAKWAIFTSQFKLYTALLSSKADEKEGTDEEDYWRYPDINWENTLVLNISKYIMVNFYLQMLYDKELTKGVSTSDDLRLKQTVAVGLTYNFVN